jgi:hypothetical protein
MQPYEVVTLSLEGKNREFKFINQSVAGLCTFIEPGTGAVFTCLSRQLPDLLVDPVASKEAPKAETKKTPKATKAKAKKATEATEETVED